MYSSPAAVSLPAPDPAWAPAETPLPGAGSVHDKLAPGLPESPQSGPALTGGDALHLPRPLGEDSTQRQMETDFPRELPSFLSLCFPGVVR